MLHSLMDNKETCGRLWNILLLAVVQPDQVFLRRPKIWGRKIFYFRLATVFCWGYRLTKHKAGKQVSFKFFQTSRCAQRAVFQDHVAEDWLILFFFLVITLWLESWSQNSPPLRFIS